MSSVWPSVLAALLLVAATLSGARGATPAPVPPGSEACGVELTAYQPTLLNKIYVAPAMAQGFRVYDRSRILSFTSSFFTVAANNGSALISAEIYPDASDNGTATVPAAAPLPNASFAVDAVAPFVAEADVFRGTLQARTFPAAQAEAGGIALEPGHYWLVVRQPSSMGWGINAPAPRDPYQPVVLTSMALGEPSWNHKLRHTALVTFGGCYIVRPSPSPSPSASPSRAPAVVPITEGVTAGFSTDQASVNVSAPTGSSGGGGGGGAAVTTVTAALGQLLGNNGSSLPIEAVTLTATNATVPGQSATYAYAAQIDPFTLLEQSYTFHEQPRVADFEGLAFTISPGSVKWSINLTTTTEPGVGGTGVGQAGLTFEYRLAGVVTAGDGAAVPARGFRATAKSDSPRTRMTSYFLPLSTTIVAQLQVFDVALLDGALVPIQHRVKLVATTPQPTLRQAHDGAVVEETAAYVLELTFPPFNRSLYYDPSLGLGVLMGAPGGKGSGDDSGALVIGVAVAVPLAILFVLAAVGLGLGLIYWQKRRSARNLRHRLDTAHSQIHTNAGDEL